MTYTEKIKHLLASDLTSYRIAKDNSLSPQFIDNYRSGKSKVENMALGKAEVLVRYWEVLKMKKQLTVENLYFSHYDNGLHELEFKVGGQTVFVRNIDVDVNEDEFYWDDEENVKKAVEAADEDDIEIV